MFGDIEEQTLRTRLRQDERLGRKRPFSGSPLTLEEFAVKYWKGGEIPYQYHTMQIEDGSSEAEQLAYNNIRALKNEAAKQRRAMWKEFAEEQRQIDQCKKELAHIRKAYKGSMVCAMAAALILVSGKSTLRHRRSTQQKNREGGERDGT